MALKPLLTVDVTQIEGKRFIKSVQLQKPFSLIVIFCWYSSTCYFVKTLMKSRGEFGYICDSPVFLLRVLFGLYLGEV